MPGPPTPTGADRSAVVVEDDDDQAQLVAATLEQVGFRVTAVVSGEEAVALVAATDPDLVTLDLGLPGIDGLEVCRRLREFTSCFVLVISGERAEDSMLLSLESGADEFLAKPLSPRELRARVAAVCRRPRTWQVSWPAPPPAAPAGSPVLREGDQPPLDPVVVDPVMVDPGSRRARHRGHEIVLTATELAILTHLAENAGSVCRRADLVRLTAEDPAVDLSSARGGGVLNVHVSNLRAKLRRLGAGELVRTVRGVGYRLEPADEHLPALRLSRA